MILAASMLPWLRPPQLLPPPTSSAAEDMAKFWRRNLQQSLLAAANKQQSSTDPLVNFLNANNDNNDKNPVGLNNPVTRSSTPNTNEPCSPPPTLMPPPYQLSNERRPSLLTPHSAAMAQQSAIAQHSAGRIPKSDPMEGQLQDMLHYNMEKCAGKRFYPIFVRYFLKFLKARHRLKTLKNKNSISKIHISGLHVKDFRSIKFL